MTSEQECSSRAKHLRARIDRFRRLSFRRQSGFLFNRFERAVLAKRLWTGPRILDIVPTHRCNLRCVGCVHYETEGPADLSMEFFREILEESAPWASQYSFCSLGELFLNRDAPEMLRMAGERGIGCNVMTNGMLVTPELVDFLVRSAQINMFTFSIDGAKAETLERLRRGLRFDRLLSAIASVVEAKRRHGSSIPVVQGNFIAMRQSIEELVDLVRLAADVGIEDLNVNYLTVEAETGLADSLFSHPELQREVFEEARCVAEEKGIVLHLPPDIQQGSCRGRCALPWDTMIIDTDGTARMCYSSWEESIGNVRTDGGIRAVWNNAIYREVRRTVESGAPFYRYCEHCWQRVGFSRLEAHMGKGEENAELFRFDWDRPGAPERPHGTSLVNPDPKAAP